MSTASQCRPDIPGDSGQGPWARGVDPLSRAIRARIVVPVGSTGCPGQLSPGSDGPRVRADVYHMSRALGPVSMGPQCRPDVPVDSGQGPMAGGVDQLFWATHALLQSPRIEPAVLGDSGRAQVPAGSTCCPGWPGQRSMGPRFRPAAPGYSGLVRSTHGFDELSQATHDLV